jgi:hypothetical protein
LLQQSEGFLQYLGDARVLTAAYPFFGESLKLFGEGNVFRDVRHIDHLNLLRKSQGCQPPGNGVLVGGRAGADCFETFAAAFADERGCLDRRNVDLDVDAIEQRPG